jgi:peptide/nickel transport system permease protein
VRARWLARRVVQILLVAVGVSILSFLLLRLIKGDPAISVLGPRASHAARAALDRHWGLDRPLPVQVWNYLVRLVHGNFGNSLVYQEPVFTAIFQRLAPSVWLFVMGSLFSLLVSVPLAIVAAIRKDRPVDHVIRAVPLLGFAMPPVWTGLMLVLLFSLTLHWFPVGGFGTGFFGHVRSMILPAATTALLMAPIQIRSLRTSLIDAFDADYVVTARSKGLPEWIVLVRHALRNAAIPSVTVFAVNGALLVGNLVIVEQVYNLQGVGSLLVSSVLSRDFPVVQGLTLFFALVVLTIYLIADVMVAALDPRVAF